MVKPLPAGSVDRQERGAVSEHRCVRRAANKRRPAVRTLSPERCADAAALS